MQLENTFIPHVIAKLLKRKSSISSRVKQSILSEVCRILYFMFSFLKQETVQLNLALARFSYQGFFMQSRQNYEEKISWDQQIFAGSGIKMILVFGIRD